MNIIDTITTQYAEGQEIKTLIEKSTEKVHELEKNMASYENELQQIKDFDAFKEFRMEKFGPNSKPLTYWTRTFENIIIDVDNFRAG